MDTNNGILCVEARNLRVNEFPRLLVRGNYFVPFYCG